MPKITNAVLAEKIDTLSDSFSVVRDEVRLNTEFRLKATGIIGFLCAISIFIGAAITWLFSKVR